MYVPAHCPAIVDVVEIVLGPAATQVKVIGPVPPLAETDAEPLHKPLHAILVMVGVIVIDAGCVIVKVFIDVH